jgi:hypothetical protein
VLGNGRLWVVRRPLREGRYATERLGRHGQRDGTGGPSVPRGRASGRLWGDIARFASPAKLCAPVSSSPAPPTVWLQRGWPVIAPAASRALHWPR